MPSILLCLSSWRITLNHEKTRLDVEVGVRKIENIMHVLETSVIHHTANPVQAWPILFLSLTYPPTLLVNFFYIYRALLVGSLINLENIWLVEKKLKPKKNWSEPIFWGNTKAILIPTTKKFMIVWSLQSMSSREENNCPISLYSELSSERWQSLYFYISIYILHVQCHMNSQKIC